MTTTRKPTHTEDPIRGLQDTAQAALDAYERAPVDDVAEIPLRDAAAAAADAFEQAAISEIFPDALESIDSGTLQDFRYHFDGLTAAGVIGAIPRIHGLALTGSNAALAAAIRGHRGMELARSAFGAKSNAANEANERFVAVNLRALRATLAMQLVHNGETRTSATAIAQAIPDIFHRLSTRTARVTDIAYVNQKRVTLAQQRVADLKKQKAGLEAQWHAERTGETNFNARPETETAHKSVTAELVRAEEALSAARQAAGMPTEPTAQGAA